VDDDLPLLRQCWGEWRTSTGLARAQFIDEVILVLPGQPARMREAAEVAYRNHLTFAPFPICRRDRRTDGCVDRIGEVPVVTLHRETIAGTRLCF